MTPRIAIVVNGRFHAFDLARALLARGHAVNVLTNYPVWAAVRFGLPEQTVLSFPLHGVAARAGEWLHARLDGFNVEAPLHRWFGRWAAGQLAGGSWDVAYIWTGVSEELLRAGSRARMLLVRGSAHIRTQDRLLRDEEQRVGRRLERPSPWMIARQEREYALAGKIVVLSTFAYQSFLDQGVPSDKLALLPLGADLGAFRPSMEIIERRMQRIRSGAPLRVLFVGNVSFQKGLWDLAEIIRSVRPSEIQFRVVGAVNAEARRLVRTLRPWAEFIPRQPQQDLPRVYAWADLFIYPTIQDGYAAVLAQGQASGLPLLVTTNCAGPDLIRDGENGWVLPIRSPPAFTERLHWCMAHREAVEMMVQQTYRGYRPRDWTQVAADFEALCLRMPG